MEHCYQHLTVVAKQLLQRCNINNLGIISYTSQKTTISKHLNLMPCFDLFGIFQL
jgi:hypothetical protein